MVMTKEITSEQAQRIYDCDRLQNINKEITSLSSDYYITNEEISKTFKKDRDISISDIRDGGDKARLHYHLEQKATELIKKRDDIFTKRKELQKEAQTLFASCLSD